MSNEELKEALLSEVPVESGGIIYKRVSGIIYRKSEKGGIKIQAELEDRCTHSITIADPTRVNTVEIGVDLASGTDLTATT